MAGRVCMVTGANSGIGKATAMGLAEMGATVILVCRSKEKGEAALSEMREKSGNNSLDLMLADMSSMRSVRQLASEFRRKYDGLHVLVNNAGLFMFTRTTTGDRLETTFEVDYLSHFLLTGLLIDLLKASAPSRLVEVSSVAHCNGHIDFDDLQGEKGYGGWKAHSLTEHAQRPLIAELPSGPERNGLAA